MKHLKKFCSTIANNEKDLIKICTIYPFILLIHYLSSRSIYNFTFNLPNLEDNLLNESKLVFSFAIQLNLLLIITILTISYVVKDSKKDMYALFLVLAIYFPIAVSNDPRLYLFSCLIADYYISWTLIRASKNWKPIFIFNHQIPSQWIGFLGTVLSALISAFSAFLSKL